MKKNLITIVTGLSGAGKSTVLEALADADFLCVDNIPLILLPDFIDSFFKRLPNRHRNKIHIAIGIDANAQLYFDKFDGVLDRLKGSHAVRLLFMEARADVIQNRFSEVRRKHPLSPRGTVMQGMQRDEKILAPLRVLADRVIDTSDLNRHELRQMIFSLFRGPSSNRMTINLFSFGYKYGIPLQADLIIDVRFLPNPFFEPRLKNKTGRAVVVQDYVFSSPTASVFFNKVGELINFLITEYKKEGKSYLTIAFGCTGGRHRSVAMIERLRRYLRQRGVLVTVEHRDCDRHLEHP